jgi:hypothetical protein
MRVWAIFRSSERKRSCKIFEIEFFQKSRELFLETVVEVVSTFECGDYAVAEWKLTSTQTVPAQLPLLTYGFAESRIGRTSARSFNIQGLAAYTPTASSPGPVLSAPPRLANGRDITAPRTEDGARNAADGLKRELLIRLSLDRNCRKQATSVICPEGRRSW